MIQTITAWSHQDTIPQNPIKTIHTKIALSAKTHPQRLMTLDSGNRNKQILDDQILSPLNESHLWFRS